MSTSRCLATGGRSNNPEYLRSRVAPELYQATLTACIKMKDTFVFKNPVTNRSESHKTASVVLDYAMHPAQDVFNDCFTALWNAVSLESKVFIAQILEEAQFYGRWEQIKNDIFPHSFVPARFVPPVQSSYNNTQSTPSINPYIMC
jgi:hypothetical protein